MHQNVRQELGGQMEGWNLLATFSEMLRILRILKMFYEMK